MTQSRERELAMRMAELARSVAVPRSADEVLSDVTAAAIELIPGVDSAGVLDTADRTAGALDLFSFQPEAFTSDAETVATVLAAHAASAILASRQSDELQSALSTRDRIGQAKGIVMERYRIDDVQAFDLLRRLSQESNVKLADVAQQVINTRD